MKGMIDRLTLFLCVRASTDLKIKPPVVHLSQTPRAFTEQNVSKTRLPVVGKTDVKASDTRQSVAYGIAA